MSSGPNIGFGMRYLMDAYQRYMRAQLPVYLRIKNFLDTQNQGYSQLGFRISPSGSATGITNILIDPPCSWQMVSLRNIGMSDGKLRFGARYFMVSQTFVLAQQAALGLSDPKLVFEGAQTVGLVTENLLFSIEDTSHEAAGGQIISWILTCNANEIR